MKDPVEYFLAHCRAQPMHPAVVHGSAQVSYGELGVLAGRLAASIAAVNNNARVMIYLPKSAEAYASMFGTLMAGGYYTPVNMDAPIHRHIEILQQFQPEVVVSSKQLVSGLPLQDSGCVFVDIDELEQQASTELSEPHELAYVIFTSGSTGNPKGVMIPRKGLAHYTQWAIREMNVRPEDRWSQHPNIAFDLSVLDIYGALCGGATLYPITSMKDKLLPASFIKRHQLTIWDSVPSVIDLMIKARQVKSENFASLRLLTFCGEPLYARHLEAIFSAHEDVVVHNTYGPTEATVSCTLIRLTALDYKSSCGISVALGHPIDGMRLVLMGGEADEGELVLQGEQLALGYWRNEGETAKAFVSVMFDGKERRAYRTGDRVVRKDGEYYFSGRIDSQVKVRGNRVELGEIDAAVFAAGFGNSCTVFVNDQLHSFLETRDLPDRHMFRDTLAALLPDYEIPDFIHAIDRLPVNQNDKLDRLKLVTLIEHR